MIAHRDQSSIAEGSASMRYAPDVPGHGVNGTQMSGRPGLDGPNSSPTRSTFGLGLPIHSLPSTFQIGATLRAPAIDMSSTSSIVDEKSSRSKFHTDTSGWPLFRNASANSCWTCGTWAPVMRSEEHTSELQSRQ